MNDIYASVRHYICCLLNEEVTDNEPLVTSGRLSSFKIIEIASWIESYFNINFFKNGFNVNYFESISSLVSWISRQKEHQV